MWKSIGFLLLIITFVESVSEVTAPEKTNKDEPKEPPPKPHVTSDETKQDKSKVDTNTESDPELTAPDETKKDEPDESPPEPYNTSEETKQHRDKVIDNTGEQTGSNGKYMEVSLKCLDCLCSWPECDLDRKCEKPDKDDSENLEKGMEKGNCGPFFISFPFWADAHNVSMDESGSEKKWTTCSLDLRCATDTIQKYFNKYSIDCNEDKKVDCIDYAAIHTMGPFGCQDKKKMIEWKKRYRKSFFQCMAPNSEDGPYLQEMKRIAAENSKKGTNAVGLESSAVASGTTTTQDENQ